MALCPIANSVGCEKCTIVKMCPLRSVVGNYGQAQPGQGEPVSPADTDKPDSRPPES